MKTTTKMWCICAIAVLCLAATGAWAMPEPIYFAQDNYTITFGELGNPISAGTSISAAGHLVRWDAEHIIAYFTLTATAPTAGTETGGLGTTNFSNGTFKITSEAGGAGNLLWTGSVRNFNMSVYTDFTTRFPVTYARPAYEDQPTEYWGIGSAAFDRTGGQWTDSHLAFDWFGTYNWNFDEVPPQDATYAIANLQGRLLVPDAGSATALLCGLVGLTGFVARRRRA